MAINKKLIHFKTLEKFNTELANGNILDTSIVFIQDAQKIWTHGTLYDCDAATLREEISKNEEVVAAALNDLQENKASKTYVDEAVANVGEGSSESIYYLSFQDFIEESGVVTADEYEKIKKCSTLMFQTFQNGNIVLSKFFINKIDVSILGGNGMVFSSLASGFETNDSPAVNQIIAFVQNEDGSATWNLSAVDSFTFKTINGEEILGEGDITIENVTEETVSNWGFTKNTGTITGVSANGTSIATSGVANIPAASTSAYGVTKLSSATNSSSTSLAATASAVKAAYDLANSYKGTVTGIKINGTTKNPSSGVVDLGTVITAHQTLKTINGESIVGSGDITIEGGSSDANVQAVDTGDVLDDVNVNYATKAYVDELIGDINSVLESIING